jgi:hypothetical protein
MRTFAISALAAITMIAATAPAYAQTRPNPPPPPPRGRASDGEAYYRLACAILWMRGIPACQELAGAPPPQQRERTQEP